MKLITLVEWETHDWIKVKSFKITTNEELIWFHTELIKK